MRASAHPCCSRTRVWSRRILEVERRRFKHQGSKEKAIIAAGFTPIAYYQRLNVMLDDERVRAAAPQMIDVLRARRDAD